MSVAPASNTPFFIDERAFNSSCCCFCCCCQQSPKQDYLDQEVYINKHGRVVPLKNFFYFIWSEASIIKTREKQRERIAEIAWDHITARCRDKIHKQNNKENNSVTLDAGDQLPKIDGIYDKFMSEAFFSYKKRNVNGKDIYDLKRSRGPIYYTYVERLNELLSDRALFQDEQFSKMDKS